MANQGDIARAQQGKDAWNAWAEDNPGAEVDFSRENIPRIDFSGYLVSCLGSFHVKAGPFLLDPVSF